MYYSIIDYTGDGASRDFVVPFDYLSRAHIHVDLNGIPVLFTWSNATTVRLSITPSQGDLVRIRRVTPAGERLVDFSDASVLRADDLDRDSLQNFFLTQELRDNILAGLLGDDTLGLPDYSGSTNEIVSQLAQGVLESELYQELQTNIATIDVTARAIIDDLFAEQQDYVGPLLDMTGEQIIANLLRDNQIIEDQRLFEWSQGQANAAFTEAIAGLATDDEAVVSRITVLEADVEDNAARIVTEETARASADDALATQQQTLAARVDGHDNDIAENVAAITSEQTARADGDSALANDITVVSARVDGHDNDIAVNAAAVVTEQSARVTADSALANDISAVQVQVGDNAAAITAEQTARADGDSALSQSITTVQSQVDDNVASIQTQATSIDGLQAQYTIKVDANGNVAGIGISSGPPDETGVSSDVLIYADRFSVIHPGNGTPYVPFIVSGGSVGVNGSLIVDGTVTAGAMNVIELSAISANLGTVTAGTFRTDSSPAWRLEVSASGLYPLWYGMGEKNAANGVFYVNNSGAAVFKGSLEAASGTFAGELQAATGTFSGSISAVDGTFSGTLTAQAIDAVDTINIRDQAVTTSVSAGSSSVRVLYNQEGNWGGVPTTHWQSIVSGTIVTIGAPVFVVAECDPEFRSEATGTDGNGDNPSSNWSYVVIEARLLLNGTTLVTRSSPLIYSSSNGSNRFTSSFSFIKLLEPPTGTHSFEIQARAHYHRFDSFLNAELRIRSLGDSILLMETKK